MWWYECSITTTVMSLRSFLWLPEWGIGQPHNYRWFSQHFTTVCYRQWSSQTAAVVIFTCSRMSSALGKRDDLQNICWSYQFCHKEMKTTFEEKWVKETRRVPLLGKTQMQELLRVLRAKDWPRKAKSQILNLGEQPSKNGLAISLQQLVNPSAFLWDHVEAHIRHGKAWATRDGLMGMSFALEACVLSYHSWIFFLFHFLFLSEGVHSICRKCSKNREV